MKPPYAVAGDTLIPGRFLTEIRKQLLYAEHRVYQELDAAQEHPDTRSVCNGLPQVCVPKLPVHGPQSSVHRIQRHPYLPEHD